MTYYHGRLRTQHPSEEEPEVDSEVAEARERLRRLEEEYRTKDRSARIR